MDAENQTGTAVAIRFKKFIRGFFPGVSEHLRPALLPAGTDLIRTDGNVHEKEIQKSLAIVRFQESSPPAGRLVVLGFVNRCGSNLLGEYLRSLPGLSGFHESLNHDVVVNRCAEKGLHSFPDYIRGLADAAGANQLGVKASGAQLEMLHKWNILRMFEAVQGVHIVRQDIVSQAVSLWMAIHTRQWKSTQASAMSEREVPYDPAEIARIVQSISLQNARIATAFSVLGVRWTTVVYERLLEEPRAEIKRLSTFLDIDPADWRMPKRLKIKRQNSHTKTVFVERMKDHLGSDW
jgi:trehalose 2-sulfotransferase